MTADNTSPADNRNDSQRKSKGNISTGFLSELIGYQLRRAQTALFQDFSTVLGKQHITPGQFGLLVRIKYNAGISQTGLAKAVGVERSTLGETIDRFEKRKLVERRKHETDRRAYALYLTDKGETFLQSAMPLIFEHEERVTRCLSSAERETLIGLLRRIADQ